MARMISYTVLFLLLVSVAIQFIPADISNPGITYDIPTTPRIKTVLKKACYDCHSNETVWPWYSKISPISWFVAGDVNEGRQELNYSEWDRYDGEEKLEMIRDSWKEIAENKMPPWIYVKMHPESALTIEERAVIYNWASQTYPSNEMPSELHNNKDEKSGDQIMN